VWRCCPRPAGARGPLDEVLVDRCPTAARRRQPGQLDAAVSGCRHRRPRRTRRDGVGHGVDDGAVRPEPDAVVGGDAEVVPGAVGQPGGGVGRASRVADVDPPRRTRSRALHGVVVDRRPAVAGRGQPGQLDRAVTRRRHRRTWCRRHRRRHRDGQRVGGRRRGHRGRRRRLRWRHGRRWRGRRLRLLRRRKVSSRSVPLHRLTRVDWAAPRQEARPGRRCRRLGRGPWRPSTTSMTNSRVARMCARHSTSRIRPLSNGRGAASLKWARSAVRVVIVQRCG
jgi:hypothetical protein